MPICNKIPFRRRKLDRTIKDDEKVWYYAPTSEVFTNYDDFFDRYIKCNSMCWTCSLTGRSNLTFEDALKSEREATDAIRDSFPRQLAQPLLWYAYHHCYRGKLDDLLNDLYCTERDRYFIGEIVWYQKSETQRCKGTIQAVEFDSTKALEKKKENKNKIKSEDEGDGEPNTSTAAPESTGPKKRGDKIKPEEPDMPSPECYTYTFLELGKDEDDQETDVQYTQLSRPKAVGSRMKLKHYFKNLTELRGDKVVVKPKVIQEYDLNKLELKDFFAGPIPKFPQLPRKRLFGDMKVEKKKQDVVEEVPKKRKRMSKVDKIKKDILDQQELLQDVFEQATNFEIENLEKWKQTDKLLTDKEIDELKEAIKNAREEFREKEKEKKKRERDELAAQKRPRDDLMCDDLKPLPEFKPLNLPESITDDMFAEMLTLLQFFTTYADLYDGEITFHDCIEAVTSKKASSDNGLVKVISAFLHMRAQCIDKEDGDEANPEAPTEVSNETYAILSHKKYGQSIIALNKAYERIRLIHAASPSALPVDWMTISEVLRLNMVTSGYCTIGSVYARRATERGGIDCYEDPVYVHLNKDPSISKKLETMPIFALTAEERLILFEILREQLVTFATFRNPQEDRLQVIPDLKRQLKHLKLQDAENDKAARIAGYTAEDNEKKNSSSKIVTTLKAFVKSAKEGRRILNYDEAKKIIEENVPWDEFEAEEIQELRRFQKQFVLEKIQSLDEEIFDAFCKTGYPFLGRDRAFRNYYYFDQLEIVLVENVMDPGECDEPTPIKDAKSNLDSKRIELTACTGNTETCPVHTTNRPRWLYLAEKDGIDKLIDALNPRGFREIDLAEVLTSFKPWLSQAVDKLSELMEKFEETMKEKDHHAPEKLNGINGDIPMENGLSKDTPDSEIMNGRVKSETNGTNDEEMDIAEENGVEHDKSISPEEKDSNNPSRSSSKSKKSKRDPMVKDAVEYMGITDFNPEDYNEEDLKSEVKNFILSIEEEINLKALGELVLNEGQTRNEFRESIINGSDIKPYLNSEVDYYIHCDKDNAVLIDDELLVQMTSELQQLVLAFVKIIHSVRMKYIDSPFIMVPKPKGKKAEDPIAAPCFVKWQISLLDCQSYSELAMYCNLFNSRILWTKDTVKCNICRKKANAEESVTCDVCELSYHLVCAPVPVESRTYYLCSKRCNRKANPGKKRDPSPVTPIVNQNKNIKKKAPKFIESSEDSHDEKKLKEDDVEDFDEDDEIDNNSSVENHNDDMKARRRRNAAKKPVDYSELDGRSGSEDYKPRKSTRTRTLKRDLDGDEEEEVNFRAISMGLRHGNKNEVDIKKQLLTCQKIVETALKMEAGYPFSYPVNPKEAPGYTDIIKKPMDLRSMMNKFKNLKYEDPVEAWNDCKLIFSNCREYNKDDSDICDCADRLERYMKGEFRSIIGDVVEEQ